MNRIAQFRDASVMCKLMFITFTSAGAALLFAMVVLAVQQWVESRTEIVSEMSINAEIIAANSISFLMLGDQKAAAQTLDTLAAMEVIEFVGIYDKDGQLLKTVKFN